MRQYAFLKEPINYEDGSVFKIMLYVSPEGVYVFLYDSPDAQLSFADEWYEDISDALEKWGDKLDEQGWVPLPDPLPDCQHDAFIPVRVKERAEGDPQWGSFEALIDGKWTDMK